MPFAVPKLAEIRLTATAVADDVDPNTALANTVVLGPLLPN